ncbi:lasso peptide biosynthesis PqqD family chaperone [Paenibacillus alginolyticus]|uniref:lasso peptide biosynthesis PqqD family chaperone n=1 Tax=Paenibacillus alginolyticus TaxID=59839 RepID=UPI0004926BD0|nr:lasso peptide biosynthesis PqqD family chaperone [Paenibacillus alginolyticus]MCY9664546.1 lasso peptide biosynthesis PqqD family chaperone [Paenibacillus alginolyticus]
MMIKNQALSLQDIVVQGKGNIVSDMGGEKVMLSVQNGKYYNLGEIGGIIWDAIEEPIAVKQLVANLVADYEVDQSECEQQVISFLTHLMDEKLIGVENQWAI